MSTGRGRKPAPDGAGERTRTSDLLITNLHFSISRRFSNCPEPYISCGFPGIFFSVMVRENSRKMCNFLGAFTPELHKEFACFFRRTGKRGTAYMTIPNRTIAGDLRKVLPKPKPGRAWVILESYMHGMSSHRWSMSVRSLPGQGFDPRLNVECSHEMKDGTYPAGTLFAAQVMEKFTPGIAPCLHSYFQHRFFVVTEGQARKFIDGE